MNLTSKKKRLFIVLTGIAIAVIWIHSAMPQKVSQAESNFVYTILAPVLKLFLPDKMVTGHLVRKIAHFTEYGVLGIVLMAYSIVTERTKPAQLINLLFTGLAVAFLDETIQIFSGRGSQIKDVWIDLAGYCTGAGLTGLVRFLFLTGKHKYVNIKC